MLHSSLVQFSQPYITSRAAEGAAAGCTTRLLLRTAVHSARAASAAIHTALTSAIAPTSMGDTSCGINCRVPGLGFLEPDAEPVPV